MRRPFLLSAVATLVALCVGAGAAHAQERVAPAPGGEQFLVPLVSTHDRVAVWSDLQLPPGGGRLHFLTALVEGRVARLPVPPRSVPFDVDLGPDRQGGVVAAYSRCAREPNDPLGARRAQQRIFSAPLAAYTTGRGCDLFRFDFATGRETKLTGASTNQASETLPSIWKDQIAFARVYERRSGDRGIYPYLYTRPVDGGRSQRQPGGSRGINGLAEPTSLDLYGRRLSFTWNYAASNDPPRGRTEVRLDTLGRSHRLLGRDEPGWV